MSDAGRSSLARHAIAILVIVAMLSACAGAASPPARPSATASTSANASAETTIQPTPTALTFDILGTWTEGAQMPVSRGELAATVFDGRLYVVGGFDDRGDSLGTFEAYDPATDTWTELAPLPDGRDHLGFAELGGKLYVSGGAIFPNARREAWVYDPATNAWSAIAPLPARRWAHAMLALGDKLYVFGGVVSAEPTNAATWAYDPATDTWDTSLAPLPTYREHVAGVVVDGKAWIIGGRHFANLSTVEVYDPATDSWTSMPDLPTARSGLTAALVGDRIHVSGGENPETNATYGQHEVFDLASGQWLTALDLPKKRHGLGSGGVDGRWIVVGGGLHGGVAVSPYVDIFTPAP